jgi:2-dehydropantoate 2-reductase
VITGVNKWEARKKGMITIGSEAKSKKVLVFGAGVLGSLYALMLKKAGNDVTVVARGRRYDDISAHGIVIEHFDSGEQESVAVKVVNAMPADEHYDFCLVTVQKVQLASALETLKVNRVIPLFLFMVNTAEGPAVMLDALGVDRVMLGFANAGGERKGHIVHLMVAKGKAVTMGEPGGSISERLQSLAATFRAAEIPVEFSKNMDAWLRYHVAIVGPLANAIYMAGGSNYNLADSPRIVRLGLKGMREAVEVLKANGFPVEPPALKVMLAIPDFILTLILRRLMASKLMEIGGARHANNAREEMTRLNEELLDLARESGIKTPAMIELHRYADPAVLPPNF